MLGLLLALALSAGPAPASAEAVKPIRRETPVFFPPGSFDWADTWDLNLEGAFGARLNPAQHLVGFGRIRAGRLFVRDEFHYALGVSLEFSNKMPVTVGVQGELLHVISGFWAQAGALLDLGPRPGLMLAGGISLVGVEVQLRSYDQQTVAFAGFVKLRLPISEIAHALGPRRPNALYR